jgi:hypothetical protein
MTEQASLTLDEPMPGARTTAQPRFLREPVDRYELHRGFKLGAAFFGWLIAVAFTVLLTGLLSALAVGTSWTLELGRSWVEDWAWSIGIATGAALLLVLTISYYVGGYVAGRLARFDGGRQGVGAWMIGLLMTFAVGGVGAALESEYDVLYRIDLPTVPVSSDTLTSGGLIAGATFIVFTVIAAIVGGKAGERYHTRIDSSVEAQP